jgi:uncharacterized protein YwgA
METMMDAEGLVLAVLGAIPGHEVGGKKRLQKLAFFAVQTGAKSNVKFFLHDFGPYSTEVANATDVLSFFGEIAERDEQLPKTKRYYKVYCLKSSSTVPENLTSETSCILKMLNEYSTIELEIASTIRYFMNTGHPADSAVKATQKLKPTKSVPKIVQRAEEALSKVGLYEGRRADQMPCT